MRRPKRYLAVATALALAVCLFALTRRRPAVTLRAGYKEFPPYITTDESGNPAGLAVQVAREAAKRAGIRVQWVEVRDAENALRESLIDLYPILTVSPERKQRLSGSVPWWESAQSLLSLRERPLKNPPRKRLAPHTGHRPHRHAFAAGREACLQAGMDDHLAKPVNLRNLGEILDRYCPAP